MLSQPGYSFGERTILTGEPRAATSDQVTCYTIDWVKEHTYTAGTTIRQTNVVCEPALYIIRTGSVTIHRPGHDTATGTTIGPGG